MTTGSRTIASRPAQFQGHQTEHMSKGHQTEHTSQGHQTERMRQGHGHGNGRQPSRAAVRLIQYQ
jgi:hypothetical protein